MLIWFNLFIPFVAIIFLAIKFGRKVSFWEYILLFLIPVLIIGATKACSVSTQTKDYEVRNFYLTSARYVEPWSTWVDKTCSKEVCTGSGEDRVCHTEYYDCSYCDNSPEYWEAYDNIGRAYRISADQYSKLCVLWNNNTFQELNRSIDRGPWGCGKDGDAYQSKYDGVFEHTVPITTKNTYKNKVQASKSVFNFQPVDSVDKKDLGLYEYPPESMWNYDPILGANDKQASIRLQKWNAKLGSIKQVHMLICVFKNQPLEAALMQENYWQSGNKNEFILCLGIDSNKKLQWTYVISWTEQEKLKIEVRDDAMTIGYDLNKIIDLMASKVQKQFVRKQFVDFEYIKVEPTQTAVIIAFILTILGVTGLSVYFVLNEFTFDNPSGSKPYGRF